MKTASFKSHDVKLAVNFVRAWEGERLLAYQCTAGVWTIGVGHTRGVEAGDRITLEESERLLLEDLELFKKEMVPLIDVDVTEGQFVALLSFVFNLGTKAFMTSTLRKRLNEGDLESAGFEFLKWKYAGGEIVKGLVARRKAEKDLFLGEKFLNYYG